MRTTGSAIAFLGWLGKTAVINEGVQLRAHQERARQKVERGSGSMAIFHGTGTGKGLTAVSSVETLRRQGRAGRVLVVTPASLRSNFAQDTIQKFTNSSVRTVGRLPKKSLPESDYYVASYARFRRNPTALLRATGADTLVLDEVQRARNPKSKLYQSFMEVRPHVRNVIGLTGSPVSNKPSDLIPIMDIIHGRKGHNLGSPQGFAARYLGTKTTRKYKFFGPKTTRPVVKHQDQLKRKLQGKIDYVPHSMVEDQMPSKSVETVEVNMSKHQKKLYRFALNQIDPVTRFRLERGLPLGKKRARTILTQIGQARQASNSIHTLDKSVTPQASAEITPKVRRLLDDAEAHLQSTPDGQIVMYTGFASGGVDVLRAGLKARGIESAVFIGKGRIKGLDRQQEVRDFRSGKKRVIIITNAGAEGISLPNATMFQSLDSTFNPQLIAQAEARARRLGGQAHRPQSERNVIMRHYQSVLPPTWVDRALMRRRSEKKSTDEWVADIAKTKAEKNEAIRSVMEQVG